MKPTFQFIKTDRPSDTFASRRKGFTSPKCDYNFQASKADFSGRCHGHGSPSFRSISNDYFKHEARGHFASEALVFGVIALVAAVPVIEGIRGLVQLANGGL